MATAAEKRATQKYEKANVMQLCIKLNRKTDADIIDHLAQLDGSKMGFVKMAIREAMKKR